VFTLIGTRQKKNGSRRSAPEVIKEIIGKGLKEGWLSPILLWNGGKSENHRGGGD